MGRMGSCVRQSDTTTLVLIKGYRDSNYVQMVIKLVPELATSKPGALATSAFPFLRNLVYVSKGANELTTPA